jgi:hypothetical protein
MATIDEIRKKEYSSKNSEQYYPISPPPTGRDAELDNNLFPFETMDNFGPSGGLNDQYDNYFSRGSPNRSNSPQYDMARYDDPSINYNQINDRYNQSNIYNDPNQYQTAWKSNPDFYEQPQEYSSGFNTFMSKPNPYDNYPADRVNLRNIIPAAEVSDGQIYVCDYPGCFKNYNKQSSLFTHIKSHNKTRGFNCDICGTSFRRSHDLKRHERSIHTEVKLFVCNKCGKRFSRMVFQYLI